MCVPIAIVPGDPAGVRARETLMALAAGVECPWRSEVREEKIRRGLWGEYATVHVEVRPLPHVARECH